MFTLAISCGRIGEGAAVFVQDTKSWKLVKSFHELPVASKQSDLGLTVSTSLPNIDMSPDEMIALLKSIQQGLDTYCDYAVKTNAEAGKYASAVPDAVSQMFNGFRVQNAVGNFKAQTICVSHGGTRYLYNPTTRRWEFALADTPQDGAYEVIGGDRHFKLTAEDFLALVTSYINSFPLNSAGSLGTLYVMSLC